MSSDPSAFDRDGDAPESISEVKVLSDAVASIARFLSRLSSTPPLIEAQLGLAEWLALDLIHRAPACSNRQVSRGLGISDQRAKQICDALEAKKLILSTTSSEDARRKAITISASGKRRLHALNEGLLAVLRAGPDGGAQVERTLIRVTVGMRRQLLPLVTPPGD